MDNYVVTTLECEYIHNVHKLTKPYKPAGAVAWLQGVCSAEFTFTNSTRISSFGLNSKTER